MTAQKTDTSTDAYKEIKEAGDDVALRRRVAAALASKPMTTSEVDDAFPEHSANALRPRVNELVRMDCAARKGKRENPSGHEAYVHHLTDLGHRYLEGDVDPEPTDTISGHQGKVVAIAREFLRGNADKDILQLAVENHDAAKQRMKPDWHGGLASDGDDD